MFVYEKNGGFIDVYKFEPRLEEIIRYKKSEMEKILRKDRVWRAVTNNPSLKLLEKNNDVIFSSELEYKKSNERGFIFFHNFLKSGNRKIRNNFLEEYYQNVDTSCYFRKVKGYDEDRYIVQLRHDYYPFDLFVMDGIINVTESLYLLEAILNKRFDLVGDKDISEQLRLFDIKYYGRINTMVLQNICQYGILSESYETIINKTESSGNILSKVKKLAR